MASSSNNRLPTATKGGASQTSTPASAENAWGSAGRRSSGGADAGLFSGLVNQKRNSGDNTAAARKASFHEQRPAPGVLGQMWNSWTKGHGSSK